MNVRGLNSSRWEVLTLIVFAGSLLFGACSFETPLSGLECADENATRPGEVCQDGYWRIDADAGLDAEGGADVELDVELDATPDVEPGEDVDTTPDIVECVAPEELCGGACVDLDTDVANCGACGTSCAGAEECVAGACVPEAACEVGDERSCYTGPAGTKGVGSCEAGLQVCNSDNEWGDCQGDVTPQDEVCNGEDDNCDGAVDENNPEGGASCDTGALGICADGVETCTEGAIECVPTRSASPAEECGTDGTGNGQDNDCNGQVDDGCASCVPGESKPCYSGPPGTEGFGVCDGGAQTCNGNGEWGACQGDITPSAELCNDDGKDENCDGAVNEGCACLNGATESCGTDVGMCSTGVRTCVDGKWGTECAGEVGPAPAELCDGSDHDCDGDTHNGFEGLGTECFVGVGACRNAGTMVCKGDGSGLECDGTPLPGLTYYLDSDGDGFGDSASAVTACEPPSGDHILTGGDCDDSNADIYPGATELCDGLDNNCSGTIDDGSNMCGADQSCQDGGCCDESYLGGPNGGNSCNGQLCNGDDAHCASGFCEDITGPSNDACFPAHCNDGAQNEDETGIDCGGSCLKCWADQCTDDSECKTGYCNWRTVYNARVCTWARN